MFQHPAVNLPPLPCCRGRDGSGIPRVHGGVHGEEGRGEEDSDQVSEGGLNDGEGGVAVGLPGHDDVAGDGGGDAGEEDQTDEEAGIEESLVCGDRGDEGEDDDGCHDEAEELDVEVDFPSGVVLEEDFCVERGSRSV